MASKYRFSLDRSSKKYICPACNHKRFVRYLDSQTDELLPQHFGRCDREAKCGYHSKPRQQTKLKRIKKDAFFSFQNSPIDVFIPNEVLAKTFKNYDRNVFVKNLFHRLEYPFPGKFVKEVIHLYQLGTISNGYRKGAITFPYIDRKGNVRTIQVSLFDEENHRKKNDFLHSILEKYYDRNSKPKPGWLKMYLKNDKKVSCLFGEHLLDKYPSHTVCLVEAPKTAIIASLYFGLPCESNLLWLAVYNLSSLNYNKCKVLEHRRVVLFPDLSEDGKSFKLWKNKADELQIKIPSTTFEVSNLLEQLATEESKKNGEDIADFLIKLDWRNFRKSELET
ncbi:DUF6371 domain-containing protein [Christiangramia salexigens]|uniref:Toprim domain-containing protein n=1 Tax=Christiangramia salexigens TaxID=1913577 RepID=A0A1L3J2I5_9FLAO|nr:DUF6371 domain-containing protein [Christiangramia salexigens]APG59342.1 hypothetical protein LPB144_02460 [Christiangramia salexigens]